MELSGGKAELYGGDVELQETEMEYCDGSQICMGLSRNCMRARWNFVMVV